jgi:sulfonate transport system ATP-binding protein
MPGEIVIKNLSKTFYNDNEQIEVLKNINLTIMSGEFLCLIGYSGCGKSTLLRIIAGLDTEYEGEVLIDGEPVRRPTLDKGMVFQDHRLFPWFSVAENVGYGLPDNTPNKAKLIQDLIDLVGLSGFEKVRPKQLSGGMAQRVAIARALINQPKVLLLDEPFGALDALTRISMQREILRIWEVEKSTMVMVTHDIDEAVYLSGHVVMLSQRPGAVKKVTPVPIAHPRVRTSADFLSVRNSVYKEFFQDVELEPEYFL